jgi:hypothetical protein
VPFLSVFNYPMPLISIDSCLPFEPPSVIPDLLDIERVDKSFYIDTFVDIETALDLFCLRSNGYNESES